jgi:hypothetical protein
MSHFLKTKAGVVCVCIFILVMALMFYRVMQQRRAREAAQTAPVATAPGASAEPGQTTAPAKAAPAVDPRETAAYLDAYRSTGQPLRHETDRRGVEITRRATADTPRDAGRTTLDERDQAPAVPRVALRLQGRVGSGTPGNNPLSAIGKKIEQLAQPLEGTIATVKPGGATAPNPAAAAARSRPKRFVPYGRPIKCELVFTLDSTLEETPLIGLVVEPVYNNGVLVIPASAEIHGVARPDRLGDRIFSGNDFVLIFPRDGSRPNGRQVNVKGAVLDRVEPDGNGMTWGIDDGAYGLRGQVIKTMEQEEIYRFAATFLAAGSQTMQSRQTTAFGNESVRSTPQNAALQGLSENLQQIAQELTAEIQRHGVFIRVGGGHQFYFYPKQIIDPDAADISSDIATVK